MECMKRSTSALATYSPATKTGQSRKDPVVMQYRCCIYCITALLLSFKGFSSIFIFIFIFPTCCLVCLPRRDNEDRHSLLENPSISSRRRFLCNLVLVSSGYSNILGIIRNKTKYEQAYLLTVSESPITVNDRLGLVIATAL